MDEFKEKDLEKLYRPHPESSGEDNGQITIIGGSKLFHGAPLLSLKVASKFVDMVFFSSPEPSIGKVAERIKASLSSFVWVPWEEVGEYINKSDAALIGPGFMRFKSEKIPHGKRHHQCDEVCQKTKDITEGFLKDYSDIKWVIDAGSLQVMEVDWIPKEAIITPNKREFEMLFGEEILRQAQDDKTAMESLPVLSNVESMAKKYNCLIVLKGPETIVSSPDDSVIVKGGNAGLTKGGTGDILAGLTTALYAKNDAFLAASVASYISKKAADELFEKVGVNYSADDLAEKIPETFKNLQK